jgi:hypothetical protein
MISWTGSLNRGQVPKDLKISGWDCPSARILLITITEESPAKVAKGKALS